MGWRGMAWEFVGVWVGEDGRERVDEVLVPRTRRREKRVEVG